MAKEKSLLGEKIGVKLYLSEPISPRPNRAKHREHNSIKTREGREMRYPKEVNSPKQGYRISGRIIEPASETTYIEKTKKAKRIGRWIYCKYCYKNVLPLLMIRRLTE